MPSVLIVEDDSSLEKNLIEMFDTGGFRVESAETTAEAIGKLETDIYDLVLTELRPSEKSGLDILKAARRLHPETEIIVMTASGAVPLAVEAIQYGASDYIVKPFKSQELIFKAKKALERVGLKQEIRHLRQEIAGQFGFDNIIGASKAMEDLKKVVARVAGADISVLLTGESGTGKELVAEVIHHHSPRRDMPFVRINCSAIPENRLESELFGHVRGAFTNASTNKRGFFEEAEHGTIFLDEVADLPYSIQAKMLRILQEQEIRPVGGKNTRTIDVRVIAATNADLIKDVREGRFREDLFYRLNVMPINIPPLRERPEDIPALAEYFLDKFQREYDRPPVTLSADAMDLLLGHDWPGNVRELENTLKRALALSVREQIRREDIIFISAKTGRQNLSFETAARGRSLAENQKIQILKSLKENNWNYTMTAEQLGIGRTTLWRKIKKFNLRQPADIPVGR